MSRPFPLSLESTGGVGAGGVGTGDVGVESGAGVVLSPGGLGAAVVTVESADGPAVVEGPTPPSPHAPPMKTSRHAATILRRTLRYAVLKKPFMR